MQNLISYIQFLGETKYKILFLVDQSVENMTMAENSSMPDKANSTTKSTFLYFEKCTPLDDVTPWCYTRVDENLTYILGI